ncbi:unnamed protein product [Musa acuminata var. zebrina]
MRCARWTWVGRASTRRIVKEVFRDFRGRRAGLSKALTTGPCSLSLSSIRSDFLEVSAGLGFVFLLSDPLCYVLAGGVADFQRFDQQCVTELSPPFLCLLLFH